MCLPSLSAHGLHQQYPCSAPTAAYTTGTEETRHTEKHWYVHGHKVAGGCGGNFQTWSRYATPSSSLSYPFPSSFLAHLLFPPLLIPSPLPFPPSFLPSFHPSLSLLHSSPPSVDPSKPLSAILAKERVAQDQKPLMSEAGLIYTLMEKTEKAR